MLFVPILSVSAVATVFIALITFVIGSVVGWLLAVKHFKKQMKDNPPISENQIRELYRQMGRKLSEKQVNQIMYNLKKQQG